MWSIEKSKSNAIKIMCCFVLLLPMLQAQLNPQWQSSVAHDFLDLYQQNKAEKVKPEIVSLFDFSTSMDRIMFHSAYPNDYLLEEGNSTTIRKSYYAVKVELSGIATKRVIKLSFVESDSSGPLPADPLNIAYTITGNTLIRPDGKVVTETMVDKTVSNTALPGSSATPRSSDVRNWVRAASHARLTFKYKAGGMADRTLDIPLNWCVIDPEQTLNDDVPTLKSLKIEDPNDVAGNGETYEVDSTYLGVAVRRMDNSSTSVLIKEGSGCWRYDYIDWFVRRAMDPDSPSKYLIRGANDPDWTQSGTYHPYGLKKTDASGFTYYTGLPRVSRLQAVKQACLMVWFRYQDNIWWAFRGLDSSSYSTPSTATNADPPSSVIVPTGNTTSGDSKKWISFQAKATNGSVHMGAKRLAKLVTNNGTPLISSYTETLIQYNDTSPWSFLESGDKVRSCTKHFVMVMTDGNPKDEGAYSESKDAMPYWTGALAGNTAVNNNKSNIDYNGLYWNLPTLAGVAAHGCDPGKLTNVTIGKNNGSGQPENYLPFDVENRADGFPNPNLNPVHPIETLTVGISLGKDLNNSSSTVTPDYRLKAAACFGNPYKVIYPDPTTTIEFNPDAPNGIHDSKEAFFFDAASPEKLVRSIEVAFEYMMATPSSNVTAMPSIPYVGMGLGHQMYLGRFDPPSQGGPAWPGDLMMFPTREVNGQTIILKPDGTQLTTDLKTAIPGWRASDALHSKGWKNRNIYTRLPATSSNWNPAIQKVSDSGTNWDAVKVYIKGLDENSKRSYLRWMMGADITSSDTPLPTRDGTNADQISRGVIDIMGDVIDSSPAVVEYNLTADLIKTLPTTLANVATTDGKTRFRVIFVGTNQGVLHAFGEVSWEVNLETDSTKAANYITRGVVDELWAFIPTDILPYINYYQDPTKLHRSGVNGVPIIYHLDLPASGKLAGNGKIDPNEWALVLFGLGKGGRSYYGIDIRNPISPQLGESETDLFSGWALVPDEANSYSPDRFESDSSLAKVIGSMGYSSNVPGVGRVIVGDPKSTGTIRDVLFLGGGYSFYDIETNYPTTNAKTKLGRSIIAMDVSTGKILKIWDMSSISTMGPISAGVVPFKFLINSGMVQRLYFTDFFGGLWSINSTVYGKNLGDDQDYSKFRIDSSMIKDWSSLPRPIYGQSGANGILSALPAPFRVGTFYPRTTDPKVIPAAVGIVMVSGNRYDPLDLGYNKKNPAPYNTAPTQHRLTVVFDRQDSYLEGLDTPGSTTGGITDAILADMSNQTSETADIINTNLINKFYLTSGKYGYYINLPSATSGTMVPKGITPPIVLSGVAFWSYLVPQTVDPCTGGTGYTYTNRLCDVMRPVFPGNSVDATTTGNYNYQGCQSGRVATWWGVASNIAAKSIIAVIQAGNIEGTIDPNTGLPTSTLTTKTFSGKFSTQYAQPRTWRTVH